MNIQIPSFLKLNSTIAITAPSFGCTTEPYKSRFKFATKKLENLGFKISVGKTVFLSDGKGISTNPKIAAKELEDFYCSDKNNAIISAGGGELMCETVGFIDFQKLQNAQAKWFLGYSDNSNFIFPLITISHTAAIYGLNITGFGKKWEQTELDTFGILQGNINEINSFEKFQLPENDSDATEDLENLAYNLTEEKILTTYPKQKNLKLQGILLGGCLDVLANLCGTKLDKVKEFNLDIGTNKIIWVLESCDGNPSEIRRQIWHLKNAGWFEKTSGFLIGRPLAAFKQNMMGIDQYNAVTDILSELNAPIIMDVDIGHIDPIMPIVMGVQSEVFVNENNIKIKYNFN